MAPRKYEFDEDEDILKVRTTGPVWRWWPVVGVSFVMLIVAANIILFEVLRFHAGIGILLVTFPCGWIVGMTFLHFGDWDCALDGRHGMVLVRGRRVGNLTDAVAARYDGRFFSQNARSGLRKMRYLELSDGRKIMLRSLMVTEWEDAALSEAADRMNAFLANRAASLRQEQNEIWSWDTAEAGEYKHLSGRK